MGTYTTAKFGIIAPDGDEDVEVHVDLMALADSVEAALAKLKVSGAWRGPVPASTNLDNAYGADWRGSWGVGEDSTGTQISSLTGLPEKVQGVLEISSTDTGFSSQVYKPFSRGYFYMRTQGSLGKPVWGPWQKIGKDTGASLPNGTDLNQVFGNSWAGTWWVDNAATGQIASLLNLPEFKQGTLEVSATGNGFTTQIYRSFNGALWWRTQTRLGQPSWGTWTDLTKTGSIAGVVRHAILEEELRRTYSPPDPGSGVPVAFIFDHGTNNFRDMVLPKIQEHSLEVTLALNSGMYDTSAPRYAYDNQTTWSEIASWPVEIANHGKTHGTASTDDELHAEIVGGLEELKANLPSKKILTWVQSGQATNTTWQGFANGASSDSWAGSKAGELIYGHHAASTGAVVASQAPLYDLDGQPRQGVFGYWVDTASGIAAAKVAIGKAVAEGKALILRAHPELLGTAGKTTASEMQAFLDWLKAEQDTGRIQLMSFGRWSLARTATPAKVEKIDSWLTVPVNYRSGLAVSGRTVQLTLNGQAGASGFTGKIGTIPAQYRPKVEAYEMGQSIGGSGVHVLTNGDVVAPTVAGGAYFKATLVWVI